MVGDWHPPLRVNIPPLLPVISYSMVLIIHPFPLPLLPPMIPYLLSPSLMLSMALLVIGTPGFVSSALLYCLLCNPALNGMKKVIAVIQFKTQLLDYPTLPPPNLG